MSVHPSLSSDAATKQDRSVLTRLEKIKKLEKEGKWKDTDSVYGLPKVKVVKLKMKKEKTEKAADATAAGGTTPEAGKAEAAPAKKAPEAGKEKGKK